MKESAKPFIRTRDISKTSNIQYSTDKTAFNFLKSSKRNDFRKKKSGKFQMECKKFTTLKIPMTHDFLDLTWLRKKNMPRFLHNSRTERADKKNDETKICKGQVTGFYILHKFLANWTNLFAECCGKHHNLLIMGSTFKNLLYILSHIW